MTSLFSNNKTKSRQIVLQSDVNTSIRGSYCLTLAPQFQAISQIGAASRLGLYTRKNLTTCSKSADKPSTSCVRTACYKLSTSLEQAVNNL